MLKKMIPNGNSKCVIIPKTIIELMDIDPENDFVKMEFDGKKITIEKWNMNGKLKNNKKIG